VLELKSENKIFDHNDILTIDDVFAINRVTREPTEQLRQFVVTADTARNHRILPIYPSIIPHSIAEKYATVTALPMNGAKVRLQSWS